MNHTPPAPPAKGADAAKQQIDVFAIQRQIRRSDLPYAAQALLCAILDRDRYGRSPLGCVASLDVLAADINSTRRYVTTLLPFLLNGDWVSAERVGKHRPLHLGAHFTKVLCTQEQSCRGAECTQEQSCSPPRNNRTCTQEQSLPVRESEERSEENKCAGGSSAPPRREECKPAQRFPHPPGQRDPVAVLLHDLAKCGWRLLPSGELGVQPGFSEGRAMAPELLHRYEEHRARIAAAQP